MKEQEFFSKIESLEKQSVKYMFKPSSLDKNHLVVIFTGFAERYSFVNVGKIFQCSVLWIRDDYEGVECYYLGKNNNFIFSDIVNELIESKLLELNLSKKECSLLGGSKGGFSSLYFGLKFNYHNIISCAPTSKIGDRMISIRPNIAKFVMGDNYELERKKYNDLILNLMKNEVDYNKNIYLFISKDDAYYRNHQKYLLPHLKKYQNFNVVMINSNLVYQHNRVTGYSVPLIMSIITGNIEKIPFSFKYKEIGNKYYGGNDYINKDLTEAIAYLDRPVFEGDSLFLQGIAYFSGVETSTLNYKKILILDNNTEQKSYDLSIFNNNEFSSRLYNDFYIDYSNAGFKTENTELISLADLEEGTYSLLIGLSIKKSAETFEKLTPLKNEKKLEIKHISGAYEYRIWVKNEKVFLSKRELLQAVDIMSDRETFLTNILNIEKNRFYIEGHFSIIGIEVIEWGDVQYYLNIYNDSNIYTYKLGMLHQPKYNEIIDGGFGVYQKAVFSTLKREGIDLVKVVSGVYRIEVVMSYKGSLFNKILDKQLIVNKSFMQQTVEIR